MPSETFHKTQRCFDQKQQLRAMFNFALPPVNRSHTCKATSHEAKPGSYSEQGSNWLAEDGLLAAFLFETCSTQSLMKSKANIVHNKETWQDVQAGSKLVLNDAACKSLGNILSTRRWHGDIDP